jgi:hypothetical protein
MKPAQLRPEQATSELAGRNASEEPGKKEDKVQRAGGIFDRVRETGERITGGGVRALGKRLFLDGVRRISRAVRRRPRLLAGTQRLLRPFPAVTFRLTRLALGADPFSGRIYIPSGRLSRYGDATALTLSTSARVLYLRLRAEASETGFHNKE